MTTKITLSKLPEVRRLPQKQKDQLEESVKYLAGKLYDWVTK
jgi:hypothetical protein